MKQRYQTPMGSTWFLQRAGYRRFMAREATAFAVVAFLIYLLMWLRAIGHSEAAYASMIELTRHPVSWAVHVLVLAAALYHSFTWFNLTPKIMPLYVAEEKVPDVFTALIMGYVPWVAATALVLWGVMRFPQAS